MTTHEIRHRAFFDDMMVYDGARVGNALYGDVCFRLWGVVDHAFL